jgi:hypothetical protein
MFFLEEEITPFPQYRKMRGFYGVGYMGGDPVSLVEILSQMFANAGDAEAAAEVLKHTITPEQANYLIRQMSGLSAGATRQTVTDPALIRNMVFNTIKKLPIPQAGVQTIKGIIPKIVVQQAQTLSKLLSSANFAAITGLLAIAYDSGRTAKAVADATDAMDEAQRTGRLTGGAVQKAFLQLSPELQQAVASIKTAQNLISGYTTLKYNTQQLLKGETNPDKIASLQNIIKGSDAKIVALSSLLDAMRAVQSQTPKPKGKTTNLQTQNPAAYAAQVKAQLAVQDAKNQLAQNEALQAAAQATAQGQARLDQLQADHNQLQAQFQNALNTLTQIINQNQSMMVQTGPQSSDGGGATISTDFPTSAPISTGPQDIGATQLPAGATGWKTVNDPISGQPIQIPVYSWDAGNVPGASEIQDIATQYPGIYDKSVGRKTRIRKHIRGLGYEITDIQERSLASTLPAAIGAVIGLAISKKGNRTENMLMGAAAGYLFGFVVTRKQ